VVIEKCVLPGYHRVYRLVTNDANRALALEVFVEEDADKHRAIVKYFANGSEVSQEDFRFLRSLLP
jgi:hypothetical protein